MKFKYFLRGLGAGIIFGALIVLVSYMTSGSYKISDDEIIKRAEKLGMVMQEEIPPGTTEATTESTSEDNNTETTTEETKEEGTETIEETSEDDSEATTESTEEDLTSTQETTQNEGDQAYIEASVTVTSGMGSTEVAKLLEDAGIIEDHLDFDGYLNSKGYSTQIRVKTSTFNSGMTYEEIAQILITEAE